MSKSRAARNGHLLTVRLSHADASVIDRAAKLRDCSPAEFIRCAAVHAAENAIVEQTLIRVSSEGFAAFVAAIDTPGKPDPAITDLLKRPALWEDR